MANEEFNPNIVGVIDDDGVQHTFEELDRIETDDGRYVALLPVYEDEKEEILDEPEELIILKVEEDEDGETYLCPIEDNKEFDEIGKIFEERIEDLYFKE